MIENGKILELTEITAFGQTNPVDKNDLLRLRIIPEDSGYSIWLDDKKIHHVEKYQIEGYGLPGTAVLKLEILVKFP